MITESMMINEVRQDLLGVEIKTANSEITVGTIHILKCQNFYFIKNILSIFRNTEEADRRRERDRYRDRERERDRERGSSRR